MRGVIVQPPGAYGSERLINLAVGQSVQFGRGFPGVKPGLVLSHEGVSRLAGEIMATDTYWTLTNFSPTKTYVVDNPEGAGEFIKVPPLRYAAPVPFEIARVVLPAGLDTLMFYVFAPMHAFLTHPPHQLPTGEPTTTAFPLDKSAKYFLVLVALCEPRLRDESRIAIPTVEKVVERLKPLASCRTLTVAAVNFHIDYLARTKLRIKEPNLEGRAERLESKREALVSLALRFNLVSEDHLSLLPTRNVRTRTEP